MWQRLALAAGFPVAVGWFALTAATGKTYHLAPLIAAAAPGALRRALGVPAGTKAAVAAGFAAVLIGSLGILIAGVEPTATLWPGQPGGVRGEVAAFAALGLAIGAGTGPTWWLRRLARRAR